MNEVNMLNIGGVDYHVDDQQARDLIAHSENGLDSQSNLPVSSRHYDEGEYLIGQDRYYYEATTDIEIGDVLAEGVNLRKTLLSDEIVSLKNQSSIAVIQCIAKRETGALATSSYPIVGSYLYWDYGLTAGLYETIASITAGDALTIGVNLKAANKIADTMDGLQDAYNITGAKNLCPNNASDTTTTDITWDVNSDGSVQVSGTAASNRGITLNSDGITLPAGTYTITTGQPNEANVDVILLAKKKSDNSIIARSNSYEYSATFTLAQSTSVVFVLSTVHTGVAINVRVFPMCRVASVTDESYTPYAMTNKQLTSQVIDINEKVNRSGWTQLGSSWTFSPPTSGQHYVAHKLGTVPAGTRKVAVSQKQEGDIETFVELYKDHTTCIVEFSQTVSLANWQNNGDVGISYVRIYSGTYPVTYTAYYML